MDKHITNQELYSYLSNDHDDELNLRVSRHIAGCKECLERTKAVIYLKEHFEEEWDDLSLGSISKLNKELNSIDKEKSKWRKKIIPFGSSWSKIITAAAIFIIVIGVAYFKNTESTSSKYDKWKKVGVINSTKNLNEKVNSREFTNMLARLAGINDVKINENEKSKDKLRMSDATEAIAKTFSLSSDDKKSMIKDFNLNSELTYKKTLDIFNRFAGEVYSKDTKVNSIKGNLAINVSGKTLKNVNISGNLYLMQGIGSGEAVLSNVNVAGSVYILGGGQSTIIVENSNISNMIVNKADGKVRILAKGKTEIKNVKLESGAKLQNDSTSVDAFKDVTITAKLPENSEVKLDGKFDFINIDATKIKVVLEKGSIKEMILSKVSEKTEIQILKDSIIEKIDVNSSSRMDGAGSIDTININAKNVDVAAKAIIVNLSEEVKNIQSGVDQILKGKINGDTDTDLEKIIPNISKDNKENDSVKTLQPDIDLHKILKEKVLDINDSDLEKIIQDKTNIINGIK